MKKRFLIKYDSSQWCGGQSNVVVFAKTKDEAHYLAEDHMEEEMRELFADEYADLIEEEGEGADEDCAYTINSVEEFDETHEEWQFYLDPIQQSNFYPEVGTL